MMAPYDIDQAIWKVAYGGIDCNYISSDGGNVKLESL